MSLERLPTEKELILLRFLVQNSKYTIPADWEDGLLVKSMHDGGMGSLKLLPHGQEVSYHSTKTASQLEFLDKDGVRILASLDLNDDGVMAELDLFKANFEPLVEFPDSY